MTVIILKSKIEQSSKLLNLLILVVQKIRYFKGKLVLLSNAIVEAELINWKKNMEYEHFSNYRVTLVTNLKETSRKWLH